LKKVRGKNTLSVEEQGKNKSARMIHNVAYWTERENYEQDKRGG
jgi:NADH:ubiquinone oxidoreductase subunit C